MNCCTSSNSIHCTDFHLTPISARSLVSSAIPPGLSDTVTTNLMSRPSAARPRSITRPRAVVSMFPPHRATTTLEVKCKKKNRLKELCSSKKNNFTRKHPRFNKSSFKTSIMRVFCNNMCIMNFNHSQLITSITDKLTSSLQVLVVSPPIWLPVLLPLHLPQWPFLTQPIAEWPKLCTLP